MTRWRAKAVAIYVLCAVIVVLAQSWLSVLALRLERREHESRITAIAMLAMEAPLYHIMNREAARPYFHYQAFYPAERAYTKMFQEVQPGDVQIPSPLLTLDNPLIRLHFQVNHDATLESPQVPYGNMRDLAEATGVAQKRIDAAEASLRELSRMLPVVGLRQELPDKPSGPIFVDKARQRNQARLDMAQRAGRGEDYGIREELADQARRGDAGKSRGPAHGSQINSGPQQLLPNPLALAAPSGDVDPDALYATWLNPHNNDEEHLVLMRAVVIGSATVLQGIWVNWDLLQEELLGSIDHLLPEATLVAQGARAEPAPLSRTFTVIPVSLSPGPIPAQTRPWWRSPMKATLATMWGAVLLAIVGVGLVLRTAIVLDERRRRFVSAVTHELRTPMTTFCMYSEMLAAGMVTDEAARREYVRTLHGESRRLAGIVENVLAFARLDRARRRTPIEPIGVGALLDRVLPGLEQRVEQSGLALDVGIAELNGEQVAADPQTVERILGNLVDNACKYGADGGTIRLQAGPIDGAFSVTIEDDGPGISRDDAQRVFRPFRQAGGDPAKSGLGLGLALARGMARELGGDLQLVEGRGSGACFRFSVPVVSGSSGNNPQNGANGR